MGLKYTHTNSIREHHGKPIYCVTFNTYDPENQDLVASVGGHQATVYRCLPAGRIEVVQVYVDDHDRPVNVESTANHEEFFCCKWSIDKATGDPLLLLAGKLALIRVINCTTHQAVATLKGHGKEVNDICVHPQHPHIILTASKDHSIRLWNISTACCVLLMRGPGAHLGEVFTLDFHSWDPCLFASGAMDGSVKVWSLQAHWSSITASEQWAACPAQRAFPVRLVAHPIFSSRLVHDNYVDCCRWMGDLLLSKSIDCKIKLWRPIYPQNSLLETGSKFEVLRVFEYTDTGSMWWVRFSTDPFGRVLACGNTQGNTYVWDLTSPKQRRGQVLRHKKCDRVVRQTAVSMDGNIIMSSTEDGYLWRWDRQGQQRQKQVSRLQQQQPTSSRRNSAEGTASVAAAAAGAATKRRSRFQDLQVQDQRLQGTLDSGRGTGSGSGSGNDDCSTEDESDAAAAAATTSLQQPQGRLKLAAEDARNAPSPPPPPAAAEQNTPVIGSNTGQHTAAATIKKKPRIAAAAAAGCGKVGSAAAAAGGNNEPDSQDITDHHQAALQTGLTLTQQPLTEDRKGAPAVATAPRTGTEPAVAADKAAEQLAELGTGQAAATSSHAGNRRRSSRMREDDFTPIAAAASGNTHADTAAADLRGCHGPNAAPAAAASSGGGRSPAVADGVVAAEAGNIQAVAAAVPTKLPEAADPDAADVDSDDVMIISSREGTPAGDSDDVIIID